MTPKHKPAPPPDTQTAEQANAALLALANPEKARFFAGFFKTGPGQYAEGDRFLGLTVPSVRFVAKRFRRLALDQCALLLASEFNEARLMALVILVGHYEKGDEALQETVFDIYVKNKARINNWNLVDVSAPRIVGAHLLDKKRALLYDLLQSKSLWDRRIAIISTFAFLRKGQYADTFKITELLMADHHDLIHKACGWMLREVGKRDQVLLEEFLRKNHARMPRTMLRYAIERFSPALRKSYLEGSPN